MIISFFGHTDYIPTKEDEERLLQLINSLVKDAQVDFYFGSYGNFDSFAYKCAKKYKETHPSAQLIMICPYIDRWLELRRELFLEMYDATIYPEIEKTPPKYAIAARNKWMVDNSDYIISYVWKQWGGAYKTLLYAHKQNKPYVNLYTGKYELY